MFKQWLLFLTVFKIKRVGTNTSIFLSTIATIMNQYLPNNQNYLTNPLLTELALFLYDFQFKGASDIELWFI